MELKTGFTITRTSPKGTQEVLTEVGWRTRDSIRIYNHQIKWFTKESGSKKVHELRKECRIPAMARSIILNYS
jgi:hypothetical protein